MTNNNHPITPPPELVEQWYKAIDNSSTSWKQELATQAARWGADQNFEAIIRRLVSGPYGASVATSDLIADLRAAFNKPFNKPAPQSTRLHSYKIGTGAIDLASVNPNDFVLVSPSQHAPPLPSTAPSKLPLNSRLAPFLTVTDQKPIEPLPSHELVQQWDDEWWDQRERFGSPIGELPFVATRAAQWGFNQRSAINEAELQKARDEELDACCELLKQKGVPAWSLLRLHRRPKPKSQAGKALASLDGVALPEEAWQAVSAALERLSELEGNQ